MRIMEDNGITDLRVGQIVPIIDRATWDTLVYSNGFVRAIRMHGYIVGVKKDMTHVALIDPRAQPEQTTIDVPYADTEEEFLKNAEKAWRAKHGKER